MEFFQTLLLMLIASQVTNACTCDMISWEEAMCPKRGRTVVSATVISVERLSYTLDIVDAVEYTPNARYQMRLIDTFATGSIPLNVNNGIFTLMFPLAHSSCGRSLPLDKDFLIVGNVHEGGVLSSNMWQLILAMDAVDDAIKLILNGGSQFNCT